MIDETARTTKDLESERSRIRSQDFQAKFESAWIELNGNEIDDVESLKYRRIPTYPEGHSDLLKLLEPLPVKKVNGNYQGVAWKVTGENEQSILIAEHGSGLEIL